MSSRINILVINAHWNNRGDEAAIRAMIDSLRSSLPIGKMSIMILARDVVDFPYRDIEVLEQFPDTLTGVADCLVTLLSLGSVAFTERGKRFLRAIDEADVVIHAPGGPSIGDIYRNGCWSYAYLYRLMVSRVVKKKPIFFYAPSMGPFTHRFDNALRKLLLKRASAIILREAISAKYLETQLGLKSVVTCDSALQNTVNEDYLSRYENIGETLRFLEENRVIGLTVTDLEWHPIYGKDSLLKNRIRESFVGVVNALLDKEYCILLIPQVFGESSDVPLLKQFIGRDTERISILPAGIDAYGQQVLISKLHSMIGMRYHSNIFAAKGGVPFLPVCYEHKMNGFVTALGFSDLIVSVEDISSQRVIDRFEYLERNHSRLKDTLDEKIPKLRRLSGRTTEVIVESIMKELGRA